MFRIIEIGRGLPPTDVANLPIPPTCENATMEIQI